jgi:hypothetical protein
MIINVIFVFWLRIHVILRRNQGTSLGLPNLLVQVRLSFLSEREITDYSWNIAASGCNNFKLAI